MTEHSVNDRLSRKQHLRMTWLMIIATSCTGDRQSKSIDVNVIPASKISLLNSNSAAAIAETQFTFVQELLKECKTKTKRILLEKLGKEAVQWGHGSIGFSGEIADSFLHVVIWLSSCTYYPSNHIRQRRKHVGGKYL